MQPSYHEISVRQASKQHLCCECSRDIVPRELYVETKGVWDAQWRFYKTCLECQEFLEEILADIDYHDDPPDFGSLQAYAASL